MIRDTGAEWDVLIVRLGKGDKERRAVLPEIVKDKFMRRLNVRQRGKGKRLG